MNIPEHITPTDKKSITIYIDNRFIVQGKIEEISEENNEVKIDIRTN